MSSHEFNLNGNFRICCQMFALEDLPSSSAQQSEARLACWKSMVADHRSHCSNVLGIKEHIFQSDFYTDFEP